MGDLQTPSDVTSIPRAVPVQQLKDNVMQAFVVSILAGCLLPMSPVVIEYGLTNAVRDDTWSLVGIAYAALIGAAARNKPIAISSFICSALCAILYGAAKYGEAYSVDQSFIEYRPIIAQAALYFFAISYALERFGRHVIEKQPYSE
jgi:hypothetical protein